MPETQERLDAIFLEADAAWESGNDKEAFELFHSAAVLGNAGSMNNLGFFYFCGIGTESDKTLALLWYRKSWRKSRNEGTGFNIAKVYEALGRPHLRMIWLKKLARRGDGEAMIELASAIIVKSGGNSALNKALKLLESALSQNDLTDDSRDIAKKLIKKIEKQKSDQRK